MRVPSPTVPVFCVPLIYTPQVTVDVADAAVKQRIPFDCELLGVTGSVRAIGGDVAPTDLDAQVMIDTTEIVAALALVDGSAIARPDGTLAVSGTGLKFSAGSFCHLKLLNVTGGTNPTADGVQVLVWFARR